MVCYVTGQMFHLNVAHFELFEFFFSWPFWTLWPPKCRYFSFFRLPSVLCSLSRILGQKKRKFFHEFPLFYDLNLLSWYIHVCCWNVFIIFFSLKYSVGVSRSRIQWPSSISENATQLRCKYVIHVSNTSMMSDLGLFHDSFSRPRLPWTLKYGTTQSLKTPKMSHFSLKLMIT